MMLKLIYAATAMGLAAGASMPALAQAQSSQQRATTPNPNEVVCQKQEVIGSRLATKRVCKTRAEWADARIQDRHELERVQTQKGSAGQ